MNDTITDLDGPATVRAYRGEDYTPVKPQADNEALIDQGERVMLYHQRTGPSRMCKAVLRIAPKGQMCTGFAIGILLEAQESRGCFVNIVTKWQAVKEEVTHPAAMLFASGVVHGLAAQNQVSTVKR